MSKTSVEVDRDIAKEAAAILGTSTLRDTIDASMREVVAADRRIRLLELLADETKFDFDVTPHAWGGAE